ncbi:hypothetical protein [Streptomyces sp. URMC 123]|uniref:hypothetical protein n=1 Tax=Streptomyces sp. URMC 123 TaxID=3423403 RepID=UPI003F1BBCEF
MSGAGNGGYEMADAEFDPDAVMWERGVDYMSGWREARYAAADLLEALDSAGVDTSGVTTAAQTRGDGSGVVRLLWPAATAREVARLIRRA